MLGKKLLFSIPFLLTTPLLFWQLGVFLKNPYIIISLDIQSLLQLVLLVSLILLVSICFTVSVTTSQNWKITIPVSLAASLFAFIFMPPNFAIASSIGNFTVFAVTYTILSNKLKIYLTFDPPTLLSPSIKNLAWMLILVSTMSFFFAATAKIKEERFTLPQSIIDQVANYISASQLSLDETGQEQPALTPDQMELLKNNPEILKKYGVNIESLSGSNVPQKLQENPLKALIRKQADSFISPYEPFIPGVLAALFLFTLLSIQSLLSIVIHPIIWLIFLLFEKAQVITFSKETREVKKIVV